ncbi:Protein of unknown function [Pyronema omphalodes CBS 100304]|uniref:Uncharacterized protein n=1 Tax=Pyronema omphalodes (strain CBS 100304) TaxID=1076935 RepID=U4KXA3_PYROM|nr:Protein of unknown function [Pyronema omphalodes CBS 100304]
MSPNQPRPPAGQTEDQARSFIAINLIMNGSNTIDRNTALPVDNQPQKPPMSCPGAPSVAYRALPGTAVADDSFNHARTINAHAIDDNAARPPITSHIHETTMTCPGAPRLAYRQLSGVTVAPGRCNPKRTHVDRIENNATPSYETRILQGQNIYGMPMTYQGAPVAHRASPFTAIAPDSCDPGVSETLGERVVTPESSTPTDRAESESTGNN